MENRIKIKEALAKASDELTKAGIASAETEARILMMHALNTKLEKILLDRDKFIDEDRYAIFCSCIRRRKEDHEPIAYITENTEFYGREFVVNKHVLIPRPDTECLIDTVLDYATGKGPLKILDLGTGSGCIAITLALELAQSHVTAVDISVHALAVAKENAKENGISDSINFVHGSWYDPLSLTHDEKFDIIVSNPPYIAENETEFMSEDTIKHEPHEALFAQEDGMAAYNVIVRNAARYLCNNGAMFLEVGFRQAERVSALVKACGFGKISVHKDLAGHNRVVMGIKN